MSASVSKCRSADVDTLLYRYSHSDPRPTPQDTRRLELEDVEDVPPSPIQPGRTIHDRRTSIHSDFILELEKAGAGSPLSSFWAEQHRDPVCRKNFYRLKTILALRQARAGAGRPLVHSKPSEVNPDFRKNFCRVKAGQVHRPPFSGSRYVVSAQFQLVQPTPIHFNCASSLDIGHVKTASRPRRPVLQVLLATSHQINIIKSRYTLARPTEPVSILWRQIASALWALATWQAGSLVEL
ncbi:hypothetical protein DFP72DRAFT_1076938 [Ephemerocybe angulata]|uniref:Uncharacterized protein n=1 Tax=Ephemerocybe angulata TaxID=980116 RepID=A0A8H6LWY8_9AGAR|nr:hypothetical protein DFP72DRAFT_1076938 [Tulosesus angulatus]